MTKLKCNQIKTNNMKKRIKNPIIKFEVVSIQNVVEFSEMKLCLISLLLVLEKFDYKKMHLLIDGYYISFVVYTLIVILKMDENIPHCIAVLQELVFHTYIVVTFIQFYA